VIFPPADGEFEIEICITDPLDVRIKSEVCLGGRGEQDEKPEE